jgi:hypothetical protein
MAISKRILARDANGRRIRRWAFVRFLRASPGLLRGLPKADRRAILGAVGGAYRVRGFNVLGHAELEFSDRNGSMHFVWVEPENLRLMRTDNRATNSHLTPASTRTRKTVARR